MGRRLFLARMMAAGVVGAAALKFGADALTDMAFPPNVSKTHWLQECDPLVEGLRPIKNVLKVFQGTGRIHGEPYCQWMAHNAYDTLAPNNTTLALFTTLANNGGTEADWGMQTGDVGHYADKMDVVAISAGQASFLAGSRWNARNGSPIPVRNAVFISGVNDEEDFANKQMGQALATYADYSSGTIFDKSWLALGDRLTKEDAPTVWRSFMQDPWSTVRQLWFDSTHASPPGMMGNQMRLAGNRVNTDKDWRQWGGVLVPGLSRLLYVGCQGDTYVNNHASAQRVERLANRFKVPFDYIEMPPGTQHADVETASYLVRPWLLEGSP